MGGVVAVDAGWEVCGLPAGSVADPAGLSTVAGDWVPAQVPGTVAGALTAAGRPVERAALDDLDWWYRCRVRGPAGPHLLALSGVATLADVWWGGRHLLRSENMHRVRSGKVVCTGDDALVVRCGALSRVLSTRRPRPRWKTSFVDHQQLRWVRTGLLGRIPGWASVPPAVGVWRPVSLFPCDGTSVVGARLSARCDEVGRGGQVSVRFEVCGATVAQVEPAQVTIDGATSPLVVRPAGDSLAFEGLVSLPHVERWWPHTHGGQPRYEVWAKLGERRHLLGKVGFRTVTTDRSGGGFRLMVNGAPVFCRGAEWLPPDPVSLNLDAATERRLLELAREAGMNMLRLPGCGVYETDRFFDRCDELGILVWQDVMYAFMDPPSDDAFVAEIEAEVREVLEARACHPSVAIVCGNQEVEQMAAMVGLGPGERATPHFDKAVAGAVADVLPGVPFVASSPTGGDVPFRSGTGISQYFGVGAYLRPVEDARRAGVRFAAECLAFATPPEPQTIDERCGGACRAGHDPAWKAAVHRDPGRSFDLEDVRDHYAAALFGADPLAERSRDAERALELGRAVGARVMEAVLTEWRRPGSGCDGALVLAFSDLRPGAGWGLVDSAGRPKAPWYALRRVLAPVALLASDEGLEGLALHVVNDRPEPLQAVLTVDLVARGSAVVERGEVAVDVGSRSSWSIGAEEVLGCWRDLTYAYRFGPPAFDAVVATVCSAPGGEVLSQVVHLPLGQGRPVEPDLGLAAVASHSPAGRWEVEVSTVRLAQWVALRVPGFVPADSWFHLAPGARRVVGLWPEPGAGDQPSGGTLHALNAAAPAPVRVAVP